MVVFDILVELQWCLQPYSLCSPPKPERLPRSPLHVPAYFCIVGTCRLPQLIERTVPLIDPKHVAFSTWRLPTGSRRTQPSRATRVHRSPRCSHQSDTDLAFHVASRTTWSRRRRRARPISWHMCSTTIREREKSWHSDHPFWCHPHTPSWLITLWLSASCCNRNNRIFLAS
jgi:hypothetical protein